MSVCLVGSWAKIPNGNDALEMAENVFINRDNIKEIPDSRESLKDFHQKHPDVKAALIDDIDQFDDQYFGVGESEAICMDPQQRMLMQGVIGALENAGITIEMASQAKVAVYTAAWAYDYKDLLPPDQYMATGNSASVMCGRITYFLNSRGAAVGIETACSSSLVAFHMARQAILNGETELALICGANHVGSRSFHSLYNSHMVSPNGRLAAFDRSANGFVRAESFAVAVLCSHKFAIENNLNIHCECVGSAFNSDGKTPSLTAPNPISQHEVQMKAMKTGNIQVESIPLVTCHGTGTKLGDQIELTAIKKSFRPDIRIISPKSSLGHGEGAAGLIGVLQSLYAMSKSIIPNQLHLQLTTEDLGENVSMTFVNEEAELPLAAISSYGFGGTNACAIIKKPITKTIETEKYAETKVLFLSAKCAESLKMKINEYAYFMENTNSSLEDILYTENTRKTKYDVRAAVFGKNSLEMAKNLRNYVYTSNQDGEFEIEFGEGTEKLWLLRMLYESNNSFKKNVDNYCKIAEECGFAEARTALFFPFKLTLTPLTYNISRLISSLASFELLAEYDCLPTRVRGRGLGQIFCLAAANVITFKDAISLIKTVIAESDLNDALGQIDLKNARVPIDYQKKKGKPTKKVTPIDVMGELREKPMPNLMTFMLNGEEVVDMDPIVKIEKMLCQLFINGYDPKINFIGKIVNTPGYSFLKRQFWPVTSSESTEKQETDKVIKKSTAMSDSQIYEQVKEIIQNFLDIEEEDVNLLETGTVDSLTSIEMIEAIGSAVNLTMPFDLLETYPTTKDIVEYLKTVVSSTETSETANNSNQTRSVSKFGYSINVISSDFMFAGVENEKELWDTLMTSKLVTAPINETRKQQCGGDAGLEVGLLKQDISLFDNAFFSIAKDESEFVDPQHRLLFHSAYNALEKSGLSSIPDADLFLAISSHSEYRAMAENNIEELDERLWMGTVHSMAAGRLAAILGIRGKSVLIDTTCSSIASALELAVESIRGGKKYAVVATTQLIQSSKWLYSLRSLLDHHSTKSFSVDGTGFTRSDGVGVIILKACSPGEFNTPLITITDAQTHHCGAVITPVVGAISQLLDNAGDFSYIEGHGTATIAGDGAESLAYQKVGRELVMSSVKAQFGHCEVASGMIQLMKVACLSKYGAIPAIVHNCLPNEHIRNNDNIRLPFVTEEKEVSKSAIVSFGITGTKTVISTENVFLQNSDSIKTSCLLPISAKTKDALKRAIASIIDMLENTNESLYQISKSMQKQKTMFKWRAAAVGRTHAEGIKYFKNLLTTDNSSKLKVYHISTSDYMMNSSSFFNNIENFENDYDQFCKRLRFEPHSELNNIYHRMAVIYALVKHIIKHNLTNKFVVSGFNSLVILAAIDAAPTHYLNDLIHAFVKNDIRVMKRIARDVTVQIDNVELYDLSGRPITTSRETVDSTYSTGINVSKIPENSMIISSVETIPNTVPVYTISQYYQFIGQQYEDGHHVDFAGIFGNLTKNVALPEYPFNRRSFWLPLSKSKATPRHIEYQKIEAPPAPKRSEYLFELNSEKWKHVRNHVVDSQIVLPGATSIRLVHELEEKTQTTLSNLDFLNKITPDSTPLQVTKQFDGNVWTLRVGENDAISFKIEEQHVSKFIQNREVQSETKHIDDIYVRFSQSQLTYRNQFQMLDSIRFNQGKGDAKFMPIHHIDVLIDGTLQAIVGAFYFENPDEKSPFLPFTIDKISIFDSNISGKMLHVVLTYQSSENFVNGSATVYDDEENVILHIENVSFKRLYAVKTPSTVSKATVKSKVQENETAKREARNMLLIWFEDNFGWTDIDDTTGFFDLGLTSIQAVKLRNAIKSQYPDASSTCVFDHPTVEELSSYLSTLGSSGNDVEIENDVDETIIDQEDTEPPTRLSLNPIGVMSASCRLPGGVTCPEELWELLKIGKNASSRIPATRIPTRNNLISGVKYGNPVEGGNFIQQDVSQFDPAFFKISKSEAELTDPQQRILLECVQECLENSGVTETSDVGVFVGLMEKEYQDMMESSSILSMLGSMAAVIAGRVNYVFGCHGPSVTIDTACSSSLVALEMAVNALLDNRCSKVIVAGVNLILNERGQGLRTNGKMLSQHGMSLSFDSRASGYGRSDGCVVLMLELAKPTFQYMSTIQAVNVNHGGRSVSLTAPNGVAHKMLLSSVIKQSPSLAIDYWEAHGTGTPLGDPIEFNTLSSIFSNIIIGSVKASLGHGEASAGTCGLLKLFMMLTNQYVPTLIHFHVLNKDINAGNIRLPIIGEDADLTSAGISSFGVSGTNAASIAFNDNNKLEPYAPIQDRYILPISAKNETSLDRLEKEILSMIPVTDVSISNIASCLANNRNHYTIRNAMIVTKSGHVLSKSAGKPHRVANKEKHRILLKSGAYDPCNFKFEFVSEMFTVASLKNPTSFALKYSLIKFIMSISPYIEIIATDEEELISILLADGTIKWSTINQQFLEKKMNRLLDELTDMNLNSTNCMTIKNYTTKPDHKIINDQHDLLNMIVNLYINGYDIDWSTIYTPVQKYIKLPNYQFNRQSLWFEEKGEIVDHYLIGTIDEEEENHIILKNLISELRHPQLFNGKPCDVGTVMEIAIEALKIRNNMPISIQNLEINQISLTKPVWLKTIIEREDIDDEESGFLIKSYIDDQLLFSMTGNSFENENTETAPANVSIPEKVTYIKECPSAIIRRQRNLIYVDSRSETSPFRTANLILNEMIGFTPNPSDMFLEIFGVLPSVYYMVQVDDGALWQFQIISQDKTVLSNIYVLKDAKGVDVPVVRMHKKSTLLSSQEAQEIATKTLQTDIRNKVKCAFNDVIDSGLDIDESQMSTGFTDLGMDSLATVDLLNRLNQKYFREIELTTSDLFDNPNIVDLSVRIEELLKEKGIDNIPSNTATPKTSIRERKKSIPANKHQEIAQIEFVKQVSEENGTGHVVDRNEVKRKITQAVYDLVTDPINNYDIETKGFTELGIDSLSVVDFVNRLNEKYFPGEDINTSDLFDYPTVNELADYLATKNSGSDEEKVEENVQINDQEEGKKAVILDQAYLLLDDENVTVEYSYELIFVESSLKLERKSDGKKYSLTDVNNTILNEETNNILVQLDNYDEDSVQELYMSLLNFVRLLVKLKLSCRIGVSKQFSLGNSIARSFLKTVTSEKFPKIEYVWDQKIQQVTFAEEKKPVGGNWLVTGGLRGIGFEIGKYLANNGAASVILVSRRQPSDEILREIKTWNAMVHTIASDIADKTKMVNELSKIDINVNNYIHSAGVLKDSKIERQTAESFNQVFNPKADGYHTLEHLENHFGYQIDNFIVMSSFTAACGNEGQLNYGVSNVYLEHQIQKRIANGKTGCAIQWGNWIDTGMATSVQVRKFLENLGFLGQHNEDALKYLRVCIEKKPWRIMVANVNWEAILRNRKDIPRDFVIKNMVEYDSDLLKFEKPKPYINGVKKVDNSGTEGNAIEKFEDEEEVLEFIKSELSKLTNVAVKKIKDTSSLMDSGLNSHLLTILLGTINSTLKIDLNISDIFNNPILENLAELIWQKLDNSSGNGMENIEENQDYSSVFGLNIFLDSKEDLEKVKIETSKTNTLPSKTSGSHVVSVIGNNLEEVKKKIDSLTVQNVKSVNDKKSKSVLMLTGQGSQYPMMGRQLCEHYSLFKTTLENSLAKCDEYLKGDLKLWDILFNTDNYKELQFTKHMQPIMFCFGFSLGKLWESFGIVPDYYLGHSVGELAAGVLAGIMSLEDGLKLIVERGKAMENIAGLGALLAVQREIADDVLRNYKVCVATLNSPKQVVFAGTKSELDSALAFVKKQGKQGTFVNQMYPFHSNLILDSHLVDLRKCLSTIIFKKAAVPLVSNVTGQIIDSFDENYIIKHTVSAVKFINCVETLQNANVNVWIDAGPAAVLATFVKRIIEPAELSKHRILQTCKEKDNEIDCVIQSCLELEQVGYNVDWEKVYGCQQTTDNHQEKCLIFPITKKGSIKDSEMDILKDHKLNGKVIIAGAYQMSKIDELVKSQTKYLCLKNIKFLKPWYLESGTDFTINWNADMTVTLTVGDETMFSAKLERFDNPISLEHQSFEKIFDVHEFYETLYKNGLQYDDGFRKMENARRSNKKCFTSLKSSDFLWPLIDAAMHSITASVIENRPDCYFLPVAMGSVFVRNQNYDNSNLSGRSWITSENEKFIQVNVALLSGSDVICEVRNMTIVVFKIEKVEKANQDDNKSIEQKNDIQIVSFDVTYPFNSMNGTNSDGWDFLKTNKMGKNGLNNSKIALLDVDQRLWDPEFFGIRPSEAQFLDPQQRLMLTSIAKLLDFAKVKNLPTETGVFIGYSTHEFPHVVYAHSQKSPVSEWSSGTATSSIAGRIAYWLKIKGPTITVDTACSSSFSALSLACDSLKSGKCKYAIVGTVNFVMHEMTSNVLINAKMTVSDCCKVFDCDANGYRRAEAVSTLLLTNSKLQSSYGVIKNWRIGHNGSSSSLFTPNGRSQQELMQNVIETSKNVTHFETHCTGTRLGDPIELNSIRSISKSENISISSIKSNIGHCEGSSGIMSLCAMIAQNLSQYRLPQLHLKYAPENVRLKINFVGEEQNLSKNTVIINNFGFTGSNCCFKIDFEKNPVLATSDCQLFYPMFLSSHTKDLLISTVDQFDQFIATSSSSLNDISYSLQNRKIYRFRCVLVFDYRRKQIWRSDQNLNNDIDDRLRSMVDIARKFITDGKTDGFLKNGYSVDLPPLLFKQDVHWKLENFKDQINRTSQIKNKLFYEKHHILKESANQFKSKSCASYIIKDSTVRQFNKLLKFWSNIDPKNVELVVFGCETNGTSHTEWTSTIRTLASEKLVPYKFVSFENKHQFDNEMNNSDIYEVVFYKNKTRYVERLREVDAIEKHSEVAFDDNLISGGTGGIGTALIENFNMSNTEIITRSTDDTSLNNNVLYTSANLAHFKSSKKYKNVFHLAGLVKNSTHKNMESKMVEELYDVKVKGAQNLIKFSESNFTMASSIGCVLGSYGQSNYVFANGLVTSLLQKTKISYDVIYWGPWKEVGMLSDEKCENINKQLEKNGWIPLSTEDSLSVFKLEKKSRCREICVFNGDFDIISTNNEHLRPLLSELVDVTKFIPSEQKCSSFESIFVEVTGIRDLENHKNTPFMDLGIDSLCLETLRANINRNLSLDLTVSLLFEYSTFSKLQAYIENNITKEKKNSTVENQSIRNEEIANEKIAVIGWSGEFSGSANIEEFWNNLLDGKQCDVNLKSPNTFDNKFFNITDEDAKVLDPQIRKFIEHAYLAMENSGYVKHRKKLKCAVFAGAEPSEYGKYNKSDDSMRKMFVMNMNNHLATYASYCLDLNGEAVSVYSACSTTLIAISHAVQCLKMKQADLALVGAASINSEKESLDGMSDDKKTIFAASGVCRPFDLESDGITRGSGVGCFVLKRLSEAIKDDDDIKFVINDFSCSNDGNSRASFMAPNPGGQLKCMNDVLNRMSENDKHRINYVECHATGTVLGDTIELDSLKSAYSFKKSLAIGSCKANIGHSYAASGMASLIKSAMILKTGVVPPQINFKSFRTDYENFFNVNKMKWSIPSNSLIGIDSFGIGGTNCHMIIENSPTRTNDKELKHEKGNLLIPVSAKSSSSLQEITNMLSKELGRKNVDCYSLMNTLENYRDEFQFRQVIEFDIDSKNIRLGPVTNSKSNPKICVFFAPQGIQYSNMLHEEFEKTTNFKTEVLKLCRIASKVTGRNFEKILYPKPQDDDEINNPENVQIAILIQEVSLYNYLQTKGIKADVFVGHSIGEYSAAVCSGAIDVQSCIEILNKRTELVQKTQEASMLMVWNDCLNLPFNIEVSAVIDDDLKCVVGNQSDIKNLTKYLDQNNIKYRQVNTSYGFHSTMLQPIRSDFESYCDYFDFKTGQIPWVSCITGENMTTMSSNYCGKHLVEAVQLKTTVDRMVEDGIDIVIEVGPSGVLEKLLKARNSSISVIPTCGSKKKPFGDLERCFKQLWANGVAIEKITKNETWRKMSTVGYSFDRYVFTQAKRNLEIETKKSYDFYTECWIETPIKTSIASAKFEVISSLDYQLQPNGSYLFHLCADEYDFNKSYFAIEPLLSQKFALLIINVKELTPSTNMVLGLIRCHETISNQRVVFVENVDGISEEEVFQNVIGTEYNHLRISNTFCLSLQYQPCPKSKNAKHIEIGKGKAIIFGASGYVGQTFCKILNDYQIVKVSLTKSEIQCDITSYKNVEDILKCYAGSTVKYFINCTGIETSQKIGKSTEEKTKILDIKTIGNFNLIKAIEKLKIDVGKLILCSSLSSIIPIFGNEDYSSANCFVDAIPKSTKSEYISNVLSLGLPPLESSRMLETSNESTKKMLNTISVDESKFVEILKDAIHYDGTIYISPENPSVLASKSLDFHKNSERRMEPSSKIENEKPLCDVISSIWKSSIGLSATIASSDNFFSLGGDSLNALQVVWDIKKQTGKDIHVNDLFEHPEFGDFITFISGIEQTKVGYDKITVSDYDDIPLTNSQTQMFVLRQVDNSDKYNLIFEITISYQDEFNWKFFKYSILTMIAQQLSYRTKFCFPPKQIVLSLTESFFNFGFIPISTSPEFDEMIKHEMEYQFNIEEVTPLRILITNDLMDKKMRLIFNQHHILTDGWSMTILAENINRLYSDFCEEQKYGAERMMRSIPKCALINKISRENEDYLGVFDYIGESSHTVLSTDFNEKTDYNRIVRDIPKRIWNRIIKLSKTENTTPYNIIMTMFCQIVKSFTSESDLLFAYADSGRNEDNSDLIGYCMNNILFKLKCLDDQTFPESLRNVVSSLNKSRNFANIPFHKIVEQRKSLGKISIYFNFRKKLDYPNVSIVGADCQINHISLNNAFNFSFTIDEKPSNSVISVDYNSGKYSESTIVKFIDEFLKYSNRSDANHDVFIGEKMDYPNKLMHSVENPEIVFNIHHQYLKKNGDIVREDDLIGITDDSNYLKACAVLGAAYAPVDKDWTTERKKFIEKIVQLWYNSGNKTPMNQNIRYFNRRTQFGAFYTIFTSGSTGIPKGVVISEQSVASFITSLTKTCYLREKMKIGKTVKNVFDVSVSNIFGAYVNSCELIEDISSAQYSFLPSAIFNSYCDSRIQSLEHLETLTIGGESVSSKNLARTRHLETRVIQIYGPTETCVWSLINSYKNIGEREGSMIGTPVENERCYTKNIQDELIIEGVSVARGYINTDYPNGKMFPNDIYKTGDIVDRRSAKINYIARKDDQVKWKGVRIDLSDLEKEMLAKLQMLQIKLLIQNQQLIAFLVGQKYEYRDLVDKLQHSTILPDYFVHLQKMPLTSSGKIDKTSLLQAFDQVRRSYKRELVMMRNSVEEKVLDVVSTEIGQKVDINDRFSDIGGNSLSAIQVAYKLTALFGFELKAHDVLQSDSIQQISNIIKPSYPTSVESGVITKLREVPGSKINIYIVHAIGGTIYPYYSFLQIFPKNVSLYGIEFELKYPSSNLRELTQFYAREIAAHAKSKQIFVMGHSMGGIMSREIVEELRIWNYDIPFVMMFDSWVLRTNELDLDTIKEFITFVFSGLPDSEHRIDKALKLARLLREYKASMNNTKLYLFKSKQLGDAAFKKAVRTDLNEELSRAMTCNGFDELSLQPIDTFLIDGDHESCLKIENLRKVKDQILAPFKPYF